MSGDAGGRESPSWVKATVVLVAVILVGAVILGMFLY